MFLFCDLLQREVQRILFGNVRYVSDQSIMSSTEDDFSPALETGLQRADSNRSWTGSQEIREEQPESQINMNTMFMLSLATIMSLFT
jgi:hypothetical protein